MSSADLWSNKPRLRGEQVLLRPFAAEDARPMARILADPAVLRLTGSAATTEEIAARSTPDVESIREWYATRAAAPDRLDLAVVDRETGELVGEVVLNEFEPGPRVANFRTLLGPGGRGRGLGTEAARLIVDHGFTVLGLHRIELSVLADNPRAQRVYEKVGFIREGVRRQAVIFDGVHGDEITMAIIAPDWRAGRDAL